MRLALSAFNDNGNRGHTVLARLVAALATKRLHEPNKTRTLMSMFAESRFCSVLLYFIRQKFLYIFAVKICTLRIEFNIIVNCRNQMFIFILLS